MKLATLKDGTRDGRLVVVSRDLTRAAPAPHIKTLQTALDDWAVIAPELAALSARLDEGMIAGTLEFNPRECSVAACRRAIPVGVDGSAYVNHVALVRKARGAELPASFWTDPLMYQGGSDTFLAPTQDIPLADEAWGCDLEAEVAVITGDVPAGATAEAARGAIRLLLAGQRREPAWPDPRRAGEGLRLLAVQAQQRLLALRGDAGRAGRGLGRRPRAPAPAVPDQRPAAGQAQCRRGHDLRLRHPGRARGQDQGLEPPAASSAAALFPTAAPTAAPAAASRTAAWAIPAWPSCVAWRPCARVSRARPS